MKHLRIYKAITMNTNFFKKKISIILPVYNESENIPIVYQEIENILQRISSLYTYEIIFVNDGSTDNSWSIIQHFAQQKSTIKGINFSKNFGYQRALTAGYDVASGDAIITMDSDMQHPPHIIPLLIDQWCNGASIVYAKRLIREDTFLKKITAQLYYKILDTIAEVHIPRSINDFRLIDKQVVEKIKNMREHSRYLRGMIAWAGFNYAVVDFIQPIRLSGKTKYTWTKLFKVAFDGIANFSLFPLKIACFFFIFVFLTGIITLTGHIFFKNLYYNRYSLFDLLYFVIYFSLGFQFFLIWLIGRNIGITYDQLKDRPLYIIAQKINI